VFGPQVLDKIDPDAIIDDYAERANLPAEAVRDKKTVDAMRQSRVQQQQAEQMAAMAEPAKTATEAAQNIVEMSNDSMRF
jgi:adenylate kinase